MEVTLAEFEKVKNRLDVIESMLLVIVREKAGAARSAHRRYKNQANQQLKQFELWSGMEGDLDGVVSANQGSFSRSV